MALRIAHLSDIHLLDLRGTPPWAYLNKRMTGAVNLAMNRAHHYDESVFDAAVELAKAEQVDRLVVTGDLTNLALESEFRHVAAKLEACGLPVTVIPGNHDAYTRGAAKHQLFERFMAGFMEGEREGDAPYPFVQRHGEVALIGLSTAIPSLPMWATGALGPEQLERLERQLEELGAAGACRVILIHHPVETGVARPRHDLLDLDAFKAVVARQGAELILHGHEHIVLDLTIPGKDRPVPVHAISSGTALSEKPQRRAGVGIYDLPSVERRLWQWDGAGFQRSEPGVA